METTGVSGISRIKEKASRIIESNILHSGSVLAVRHWDSGNIIEIDCHLPEMDMRRWIAVPYIKIRIAPLEFRDYSPSGWDFETSTFTLFIDCSHEGHGVDWACSLSEGSEIRYLKTSSTHQAPIAAAGDRKMIGLGDQASLGHLLALEELAVQEKVDFAGAVLFGDHADGKAFENSFHKTAIRPIYQFDSYGHRSLWDWIEGQDFSPNDYFFLAGSHKIVGTLRSKLKDMGCSSSHIKVQGFW